MISIACRDIANDDDDFTVEHYRKLLRLARRKWPMVGYEAIPFGQRFLLWRHDCDYSLNRALALARIEYEEGVRATYFVNPHCEFYHLLERGQLDVVQELLRLGHYVGLHFDGMFHTTHNESELVCQLETEASLLECVLGIRPAVFSFHNPSVFHLSCDQENYAGMVNCYSRRFKSEVAYCSDSNGYWRFQRLHDLLERGDDTSLQVLTHPGWWQDEPMTPRQRVFRSVYGRADATIRFFDQAIEAGGRENPGATRPELAFLRAKGERCYELFDQLFHRRDYAELQLALWRLLCLQVRRLCEVEMLETGMDAARLRALFHEAEGSLFRLAPWTLFEAVFSLPWECASNTSVSRSQRLQSQARILLSGGEEDGNEARSFVCLELLGVIDAIAQWGAEHDIRYDGLKTPSRIASRSQKNWQELLKELL